MKVIVIGSGISGLAALHTLRRNGIDAVCLEKESTAGGRSASETENGYIFDTGTQFLFRHYDSTRGLAEDMGIDGDLASWPFRIGLYRNGRFHPALASINPLDQVRDIRSLMKFRGLSPRAVMEAAPVFAQCMKRMRSSTFTDFDRLLDIDDVSLAEFVVSRGGKEALEYIFGPVASCLTLADPEEIGAGYGLGLLWNCLNGLWSLEHGIGELADSLSEKYREHIKFSTPAKKIIIDGGTARGVETPAGMMDADAVICTTTATTALRLAPGLPDTLSGPLRLARYSASCHVMFALERRLLPRGWYAVSMPRETGSFMSGLTENSVKSRFYAPEGAGLAHCFTYGRYARELNRMSDSEIRDTLVLDVRRFIPGMPDNPVTTKIRRWDEAVCTSAPGMLKAVSYMKKHNMSDVEGLFLAGDYLNMPSVEGSAKSGIAAAEAATERLG